MFQNPLVQTILLFFGAFSVMTILKKRDPFGTVLTVLAGLFAVIIWMLHYNRRALHNYYQNPVFKPVIDLICQMTGEKPPVDGSDLVAAPVAAIQPVAASGGPARPRAPVSARNYQPGAAGTPPPPAGGASPNQESTPLMLITEGDFTIAGHQLNQRFFGIRPAIDQTLLQIRRNLKMREKSSSSVALPPLGLFLFTGRQGLGKRTLATEIGRRLYRGDSVGALDLAQPEASMEPIIAEAKANPYQTFVLENIDKASSRIQTDLLTVVAGQPLSDSKGDRVSFRHCCFILVMHKEAPEDQQPVISSQRGGFTVAAERLAGDTSLDRMLAQGLHGVIPFHLPELSAQAEAVALMMDNECRKFQLTLGSVSPEMIAREVQEISSKGSFASAPMRVSRVMSRAIHEAIERQQTVVNAT
jgi:hypothetical protein